VVESVVEVKNIEPVVESVVEEKVNKPVVELKEIKKPKVAPRNNDKISMKKDDVSTPKINTTVGKKIKMSDYTIVQLPAKSGKILDYYMNNTTHMLYKKVSDGVIGVEIGNISLFGKIDDHGHVVLS
jgi:hypothetical protein